VLCEGGVSDGYTTVKDAVRQLRRQAPKEVIIPLTQPSGEAQVDFGCASASIEWRRSPPGPTT